MFFFPFYHDFSSVIMIDHYDFMGLGLTSWLMIQPTVPQLLGDVFDGFSRQLLAVNSFDSLINIDILIDMDSSITLIIHTYIYI